MSTEGEQSEGQDILFYEDVLEYEKALYENKSGEESETEEFKDEIAEYEKALETVEPCRALEANELTLPMTTDAMEKKLSTLTKFIHKKARLPRIKVKVVYERELAEWVQHQECNASKTNLPLGLAQQATRWKAFREHYPNIFLIANGGRHRGDHWKIWWDKIWNESFAKFSKFVEANKRLPEKNAADSLELDLYAWYKKQVVLHRRHKRNSNKDGNRQRARGSEDTDEQVSQWELFCSEKMNIYYKEIPELKTGLNHE